MGSSSHRKLSLITKKIEKKKKKREAKLVQIHGHEMRWGARDIDKAHAQVRLCIHNSL